MTQRVTAPDLDFILGEPIPLLDHGFIRPIDYMGNDSSIVQAARVSYGDGTKTVQTDEKLIRYLLQHEHTSPFEMCEIKIHAKMPIFVARQWVRHRTASINEYSGRYSVMSEDFYLPKPEHTAEQDSKQGRGVILNDVNYDEVVHGIEEVSVVCSEAYRSLLEDYKLSRELARIVLPVNFYTEWYWKTNLHNLMHFIKLRSDSKAQYEIRVYADALLSLMEKWVPTTHAMFKEQLEKREDDR